MTIASSNFAGLQPFDVLPEAVTKGLTGAIQEVRLDGGVPVYHLDEDLPGLFTIADGRIEVRDRAGSVISVLSRGQCFGERGLLRDGKAVTQASALEPSRLYILPRVEFDRLRSSQPRFEQFFERSRIAEPTIGALSAIPIHQLAPAKPLTCSPEMTVKAAAELMRQHGFSCLPVTDEGRLVGILTNRDLATKVVADGLSGDTPVAAVMVREPVTLPPSALGADALLDMLEHGIGHLPIADGDKLIGILTQTDLVRHQAISSTHMVREIARAQSVDDMVPVVARIPQLLTQLVSAGHRHESVTRMITDIADAVTRRLLALAEARLGPPPVAYLWLACGSQGRREQTGVSDQDNCLFLADDFSHEHDTYFAALAEFVSDGLAICGYFKCPGDMMATNPRWRQPVRVWRDYFSGWVRKPDPMAQMLASVMFDLRPIGGDEQLYLELQAKTLAMASANSIFVAHMIANSIKHSPALGLFGGFSTVRSGEHRGTVDLKLNGVVPVVDLGRVYALRGQLTPVGTRTRLLAAQSRGIISSSGARDLIDAYDLIAQARLRHQLFAVQNGAKPDNFLKPSELSDLERNYLRDAFVVVRTMQSAIAQGKVALT